RDGAAGGDGEGQAGGRARRHRGGGGDTAGGGRGVHPARGARRGGAHLPRRPGPRPAGGQGRPGRGPGTLLAPPIPGRLGPAARGGCPLKIAMVSEHASPLAALGGVDAGGQNVHVASLARAIADKGHEVRIYTRRDDPGLPERVPLGEGVTVVHVPAGPPEPIPKDELLPYIPEFARWLAADLATDPPDIVHSHFWMSGLAALAAARDLDRPVVHTYHALGVVKRRRQGDADTSPPERINAEAMIGRSVDAIIATCGDEVTELLRMRVPRRRACVVPCGVDTELFTPEPVAASTGKPRRLVSVGRLVPRKGLDTAIEALCGIKDAELVIAGGPPAAELDADPEVIRLRRIAAERGVADRVRFLGRVPRERVPELLRSAAVTLCVPWYEP